ncbi:MAG: tetratricopeptide repeat protein [Anaerosomatales bacterium]|nr:tetratricopeptide repeat protein [Anaerosomatales bacterium]
MTSTVKFRLSSRQLDYALKAVAALVVVALLYLAYTAWDYNRRTQSTTIAARAVENLAEAVRKDPRNPNARILLAQALAGQGRLNDAIEQFQAALKLDEDNPAALEGLGMIALKQQQWATAEGYFRRIIDKLRGGQFANADNRLERAYYYLGVTLIKRKQYEDAAGYLKEALRIRRDASDTHYALSVAYRELGIADKSRQELETALAFDPLLPEANYDLGRLLVNDGDLAGAAEAFRRAIDGAPGQPEPLQELEKLGPFADRLAKAKSLLATDKKAALVEARIASALDPKNLEAARIKARLLQELGSAKDAADAWEKVLQLAPEDPEATAALNELTKKQ